MSDAPATFHRPQHVWFSPARIATIASNTLLELVRLKVFYFLVIFAALIMGSSVFTAAIFHFEIERQFQVLKDVSLGAMSIFTWLLGQPVKDTLCGTKVLSRSHYERIAANRAYFGDFDPFGDFDLLFGAAKLNLKIADVPIRYRERTYGETNIQRWRHGWLLARMVTFAARKLKFV